MLSTDVSLHIEEAPLGLVAFSGVFLAREEWTKQSAKRKVCGKSIPTHKQGNESSPISRN